MRELQIQGVSRRRGRIRTTRMGRPSKWTPEFREEPVRLYRSGSSSIPEVARGLGINPETFRKWVKQAQIEAGEVEGYTREEKAEIVALRRRVARLEEEKQILQKAAVYFSQGDRSAVKSFRLVEQERGHHAVSLLCAVLRVTRQGYYAWRRREATPGPRRQADAVYGGAIMRLYTRSRETYGAPRITGRLRIEEGIRIGQKRTARLMRELGIKGVARGKKHPRTTIPDAQAPPAPDRLERDFKATGPDQKWCADITYVETREGYLSSWPS